MDSDIKHPLLIKLKIAMNLLDGSNTVMLLTLINLTAKLQYYRMFFASDP